MANIKKYNPDSQNWETWASNSASGVYSDNPTLLPEDENSVTVEDALVRDREDIETMKKNISWLALHGGRGGGGGGGTDGSDIVNTIQVYDQNNRLIEKELVWKSDYNHIFCEISSSKTSNKFTITATLDGNIIYRQSGIAVGKKSIAINRINAYSSDSRHTLRISISDSYDNSTSTDPISILETNVKLFKSTDTYIVNKNELTQGATLGISCQSSIIGRYLLYWGDSYDIEDDADLRRGGIFVDIVSTSGGNSIIVPYWSNDGNCLLIDSNVGVGKTLVFYFLLVSYTDPSIKSEVLKVESTVVSPNEIAIQPISLSPDFDKATRISKASIMSCNFIAYLRSNNALYDYTVTAVKYNKENSNWDLENQKLIASGIGKYSTTTTIIYNELPGDEFFQGDELYRLDIWARDRTEGKTNTTPCYVEIQPASDEIIPLHADNNVIFDFKSFGSSGLDRQNWVWNYENQEFDHGFNRVQINTTANLYNMGGKSKMENNHCRLTNKAYMVVNRPVLNEQPIAWFPSSDAEYSTGLISNSYPRFTLSICYYNDFTPDDNRTILNWGNYKPKSGNTPPSGKGILINNHDFYIQVGPGANLITGKIQDSIYHEIDIVFGRNNTGSDSQSMVEVYHNGVLLALSTNVSTRDIFGWNSFSEILIGCYRNLNGTLSQNTNLKLQALSLYATAFTPYQVVCNWINNLVTWDLDNNSINTRLLNEKLNANLITRNSDKTYSCALWDNEQGNDFNDKEWILYNEGWAPEPKLHWACPIPIIILDFSGNPLWDWDTFRTSWATAGAKPDAARRVPFCFCNPNGGTITKAEVTVEGQGTTSLGYTIKNLNIDFGENLFWVKQDWFPEKVYTLKADVVDSAHANNACIGRFVNTCAQNTNLLEPTPPMTYFNNNKSTSMFELPQKAIGNNGVSVKHTLEGFPVLLIARFPYKNNYINKSLGIYSFNLGRDSYYNMGFQMLRKFKGTDGEILSESENPPVLLKNPTMDEILDFNAESWEGIDSINCSERTNNTKTEIDNITGGRFDVSANAKLPVQLDGYFWSSYPGHILHFWENKYPGGASIEGTGNKDDFSFQNFCRHMVASPYSKGTAEISTMNTIYQYNWDDQNKRFYIPDIEATNAFTIQRLNRDVPIRYNNAVFYYVICMLFGLVDSLGKNLNMRIWKNSAYLGGSEPAWHTCFYDMDTAMGIDNRGSQIVRPDVLDEELINSPELIRTFASGTGYTNEKMYTVKDNKLWGALDNQEFKDQYVGNAVEGQGSSYAKAWSIIRSNYLRSVDEFMDNYFNNQTGNVGELLYNQDFDVKYIHSSQSEFMYGDRKAFVRDWMLKRIKFLDSYFGYLQQFSDIPFLESPSIEDCSYKNSITISHNSGTNYIPMITNSPCIITTRIGGQSNRSSYYIPENTAIDVKVASSLGTPGIQTTINNSDLLLEIEHLSDLKVQGIVTNESKNIDTGGIEVDDLYGKQYGTLSGFTKFNLSGNKTLTDNGIDFIKLFKTWNNGENTLPYTLTELNLSGTNSPSVKQFPLNLRSSVVNPIGSNYYQNPFENLTDIDITNSCVTSVLLPENIALYTLKIAGSAIASIDLTGQSVLKTLDFSNCVALTDISLRDCSALETLTISSLPLLQNISIFQCDALQELTIDMGGMDNYVTINIDKVDNLKKLSIVNVRNSECPVVINAENLEELSLYACQFESFQLNTACRTTLKSLDLSYSRIKVINWFGDDIPEGTVFTSLDLWGCPELVAGGINIRHNEVITNVQLPNDPDNPVNINFDFDGCTNLTRIFGNLLLNKGEMFSGCSKFKIHGGSFNGQSTKSGSTQLRLADSAGNGCLADVFQTGRNVTNLTIDVANASYMFSGTAVDAFDVYYVLRHLTSSVTNISHMFSACSNIKMNIVSSSVDNSPHWTMFDKCTNVTNVASLFYNSNIGNFRLYGNHLGESNESWAHQGLLTPLKNCTNFSSMFVPSAGAHACNFITDVNAFKLDDGEFFGGQDALVSITNFCPKDVYNNVNKMSNPQAYTAYNSPGSLSTEFTRGSLKGFFKHLSKLNSSLQYVMYSLRYLDFGDNDDPEGNGSVTMDRIPLEVTSLEDCFTASSTRGTVDLKRMFTRNDIGEFNITRLDNCFDGSSGATFPIDNNTLKGFTHLVTWTGVLNGVSKSIATSDGTFPYDILDDCRQTITTFSGFFSGVVDQTHLLTTVLLPGTLFHDCPNLSNISSCFSSFGIEFKLTPNGFLTCPKLSNVSSLFSGTTKNVGGVPSKFFNTGIVEQSTTLTGATINQKTRSLSGTIVSNGNGDYTLTEESGTTRTETVYRNVQVDGTTLIYNPMSTYIQRTLNYNGSVWISGQYSERQPIESAENWGLESEQVTKLIPKSNITNMSYCFGNNTSFPVYNHTLVLDLWTDGGDVEPNPDYCPFDYLYENGEWRICTRNEKKWTFMWAYDGYYAQIYDTSNNTYNIDMTDYELDDEWMIYNVKNSVNDAYSNYMYPPDLFRWCRSTVNINSIFWRSNFKGRICPYWLKPIPNLTSLDSVFSECEISAYSTLSEPNTYITIPYTFFTYAPDITNLSGTFSHDTFFSGAPLSQPFSALRGTLNVSSIFYGCHWNGGTEANKFKLSGVFYSNKINNAGSAFAAYTDKSQYIEFNSMFSTDRARHPYSADNKVFYGYTKGPSGNVSKYVKHEDPKTCDPLEARKNYAYDGE